MNDTNPNPHRLSLMIHTCADVILLAVNVTQASPDVQHIGSMVGEEEGFATGVSGVSVADKQVTEFQHVDSIGRIYVRLLWHMQVVTGLPLFSRRQHHHHHHQS